MATYTGHTRTNHFEVKSVEALSAELRAHGLDVTDDWDELYSGTVLVDVKPDGRVALFLHGADSESWPMLDASSNEMRLEEGSDIPDDHGDLADLVAAHLAPGQVAVFKTVNRLNFAEINGTAIAVNAEGETRKIDLDDIDELAKQLAPAGATVTSAMY